MDIFCHSRKCPICDPEVVKTLMSD
ncbi:MAG: hypothetical protein K0R18_536, partial [Bacillales bacterium]|nr:hypothetical protein [Bacillales bacterium]